MPKIPMELKAPLPPKQIDPFNIIDITPDLYKEYQMVMLNSGYKKWVLNKIHKIAHGYIPGVWLGVKDNGRLVAVCAAGFGGLKDMKVIYGARIEGLAVLPDYRNRGIATMLVSEVINRCRNLGYINIYVAVHSERLAAVKVYKKVGFREVK